MDLSVAARRPRLVAAVACFMLGAVVLVLAALGPSRAAMPDPPAAQALELAPLAGEASGEGPAELIVYVTGAVVRPDVYRLPAGARVKDGVVAAGGLAPDAAPEAINLAEPLGDAAHVHVPNLAEVSPPAGAGAGPEDLDDGLIELNRATVAELEELPGIGKTLAERIVSRRSDGGPYAAVEDLREVPGVGEKLYAQIAPLVTVRP